MAIASDRWPWLVQMGWPDVAVLENALAGELVECPEPAPDLPAADTIDAQTLNQALDAGDCRIIDFASSLQYRAGHIPGAAFAVRARIEHHDVVSGAVEKPGASEHGGTAAMDAVEQRDGAAGAGPGDRPSLEDDFRFRRKGYGFDRQVRGDRDDRGWVGRG